MEKSDVQSVPEEGVSNGDKAYEFAEQHRIGPLSDADNKRVLAKIDRHLLPLVWYPHPRGSNRVKYGPVWILRG